MNSPKNNLTDLIRQIIKSAYPNPVPLGVICEQTDMVFPEDKKKVNNRIGDLLRKSGEIERVSRGIYRYVRPDTADVATVAGKIWGLLRIRHKKGQAVTTADLTTICGASNQYAREKMQLFTRLGVCKKTGLDSWRMIADPVKMPEDTGKIERLRRIRHEKKKVYLQALDAVITAGIDARMAAVDFNDALDAELAETTAAQKGGPHG
jgi:hypothetical protein